MPIFGTNLMTGEERVFSGQANRPDGVFNRVGVQLETAVVEEAGEAPPMREPVTDVFSQCRA